MSTTTRVPRTEIPDALIADFGEIQCECHCGCTNTARLFVIYHCMGCCTRPEYQPDGENSEFLCVPCFQSLAFFITQNIVRMLAYGHRPECTACHKPARQPADMIRKVEPL